MTRAGAGPETGGGQAQEPGPARRFRREALASRNLMREFGPAIRVTWPGRVPGATRPRLRDLPAAVRRLFQRRVPLRIQSQSSDCGPACLAMTLGYHGVEASVDALRDELDAGRGGVRARALLNAARSRGLTGRGVQTSLAGLRDLPRGSILFWEFNHFVVLEHVSRRHVQVADPALGRRHVPMAAADQAFTGVALEFQGSMESRSRRIRATATPWRLLWQFLPRCRPWVPLAGASLLLLPFTLAVPFATAYVVQRATAHSLTDLPQTLALAGVAALLFFLLQIMRAQAIVSLQAIADKRVTLGLLDHLLSLPYGFFARRSPGDLAMRVRTSTAVRQVLTSSTLSTVFDGLLVLAYLAALLIVSGTLTIVVAAAALLQILVLLAAWGRQVHLGAEALETQARAQSELTELLSSVATLKSAGLAGTLALRWSHALAAEINARTRSRRSLGMATSLSAGLQLAAPLSVLATGAVLFRHGAVSLGTVIGFSTLAMGLFVPVSNLVLAGLQVSSLAPTLTRLADVLEAAPEQARGGQVQLAGLRGDVEFRGVCFSYERSSEPVLRDISLAVRPGGFLAILGASGSGKSTLAMLLAGLYEASDGEILIDGAEMRTLDRAALRQHCSFICQDARIFEGSVYDNIAFGNPEATPAAIAEAARLVAISPDIEAMPMRYETLLGPGGIGLSGGQRQRIVLARALVRRPALLIMDEATSALDPVTERQVLDGLLSLDMTLIVIAHRLAEASRADQVAVLSGGRVAQLGSHAELLQLSGQYRQLCVRSAATPA
jgi:ATP-binding cassette, subfamily B, bacterial